MGVWFSPFWFQSEFVLFANIRHRSESVLYGLPDVAIHATPIPWD